MFADLMEFQFLQNALLAGLFASVVAGIIGVIVVEKHMIMMTGGIAHASYGGVGLGYLLGFEPILGAFLFSCLAAFSAGALKRKGGTTGDIVIGLFWSLGMALGIVFVSLMPGYPPNLSSYLFGNILAVTKGDLLLVGGLGILIVVVVLIFFEAWKAYLFDGEFASIRGISTRILEYLLLFLVALSVVALIRIVGIILAQALLIAPAATARLLFKGLRNRILGGVAIGMVYTLMGLFVSYTLDIASGAMIVLVAILGYGLVYFGTHLYQRRQEVQRG